MKVPAVTLEFLLEMEMLVWPHQYAMERAARAVGMDDKCSARICTVDQNFVKYRSRLKEKR